MPALIVTQVAVSKLKASEYNPRKLSSKAEADLAESLKGFGLVDPILVNSATSRKNAEKELEKLSAGGMGGSELPDRENLMGVYMYHFLFKRKK